MLPVGIYGIIDNKWFSWGDRFELRWFFARHSAAAIAEWLDRRGQGSLPAPHLVFWKLVSYSLNIA